MGKFLLVGFLGLVVGVMVGFAIDSYQDNYRYSRFGRPHWEARGRITFVLQWNPNASEKWSVVKQVKESSAEARKSAELGHWDEEIIVTFKNLDAVMGLRNLLIENNKLVDVISEMYENRKKK